MGISSQHALTLTTSVKLEKGVMSLAIILIVTPLGLSCWHVSLMYLYSAIYDLCELIMCTTSSLDAHTGHFHYLDT